MMMWHPLPCPPPLAGEGVVSDPTLHLSLPRERGRVGEGVTALAGM
jgi:hypothetical protein